MSDQPTGGPIPADVLKKIELPPSMPICGNCPFHASDPIRVNAMLECHEGEPKILGVFGVPDKLGNPGWSTISVFPQVQRTSVCGKHPVLKARAELAYRKELERLEITPT